MARQYSVLLLPSMAISSAAGLTAQEGEERVPGSDKVEKMLL